MSDDSSVHPRFILPTWPNEPFMLIAERGKFEYGPFEAGDFLVREEDGALDYSDGATHPIRLRVSLQVGDLLFANNGEVEPMTYRIVPASAYDRAAGGIGPLIFDGDPLGVLDKLGVLTRFIDRQPVSLTLAAIQEAMQPLMAECTGDLESVTPAVLEGALIAAERFARLGDVIRTTAIALLLPELLEPGEQLLSVSTYHNGSSPFDIETDQRVGCLRLTRWARVGDDRKGLLSDYAKLAAEPSPRRAELYVLGEWAEQMLYSGVPDGTALGNSAATSLMTPFGDLSTPFQDFSDVADERVSIIDVAPTLSRLIGQGPGSASDPLPGRNGE